MKLESLRPLAALFVALGLVLGAIFTAAPASAQDAEDIPWYMPQAWVHPPQTGPKIRKLPGEYGHTYRNRAYGGFGDYCYGDCGYRAPGTVISRGGAVLRRPTVAAYDEGEYMIVPRTLYEPPQPATELRRAAPVTPAVVSARTGQRTGYKPKPTVTLQNGVNVIYLTPPPPKN